jgi:hypothetical protein
LAAVAAVVAVVALSMKTPTKILDTLAVAVAVAVAQELRPLLVELVVQLVADKRTFLALLAAAVLPHPQVLVD